MVACALALLLCPRSTAVPRLLVNAIIIIIIMAEGGGGGGGGAAEAHPEKSHKITNRLSGFSTPNGKSTFSGVCDGHVSLMDRTLNEHRGNTLSKPEPSQANTEKSLVFYIRFFSVFCANLRKITG